MIFDRLNRFATSLGRIVLIALCLGAPAALAQTSAPTLLSPADGQSLTGNVAHFAWTPADGAASYELWLDGRLVEALEADVTDRISAPLAFGEHEWKLVSVAANGSRSESPRRRFTLDDAPLRNLPAGAQLLRYDWRMRSSAVAGLDGKQLTAGAADVSDWWTATLPSTCLTTLVRNGVYPNPYEHLNNMRIPDASDAFNAKNDLLRYSHIPGQNPWVAPYWFRCEFVAAESLAGAPKVWLNLGEINYRADVWLNGKRVATRDELVGMERSFRIDVTDTLRRDGKANRLAIAISGLDVPAEPSPPPLDVFQFPGRNMGSDGTISHNYTKWDAIGWDWQPAARDRDMGLVEDVFLEPASEVELADLYVAPVFPESGLDRADVNVSFVIANASKRPKTGKVRLELKDPEGQLVAELERPFKAAGNTTQEVSWTGSDFASLKVTRPQLWWPHGYGEQPLYRATLSLRSSDGQADEQSATFGFRKVETYISEKSQSRVFVINGQPIYSQGGNWVIDWLLNWTASRYEREILSAKQANLNTLRIWGPTGVAPQRLYEAADRAGILIWQDFLNDFWGTGKNTPGFVPEESLFEQASIAIIKKLRNHPSLVIWCGGNEGPNPREPLLRKALAQHDPHGGRFYLSASDGDGLKGGGPYHNLPPRQYFGHEKLSGFNSEVGPSGVPEWESLNRFLKLPPETWVAERFPINGEWTYHDATNRGENDTRKFTHYDDVLRHSYGGESATDAAAARDYAWKCQLVNYEAYRAAVESLNKGFGIDNTGFSFWKYNSSWPSVLWQLIDWYEQPHAGFYGARKALESLHPQYNYDDGSISVINRERAARNATVEVDGYTRTGEPAFAWKQAVEVGPGSALKLDRSPPPADESLGFLRLRLVDPENGQLISTNAYWLQQDDRYQSLWQGEPAKVDLTHRRSAGDGPVSVTLSCPTDSPPAVLVRLKLIDAASGLEVLPTWWSDNYVTLMPGESRSVEAQLPASRAVERYRIEASSPVGLRTASPEIQSAYLLTDRPLQRGRTDFVVMLQAEWQDPYDSRDVALDLALVAPSGARVVVPCFYESGESGQPSVWEARFAPAEAGSYSGHFELRDDGEVTRSALQRFDVEASDQRGFLRPDTLWTLRFDNGEPFRGVGENICWEARSNDDSRHFKDLHENPRFNYEYMLGRLRANGGNFFRTWMCPWNLPLEWNQIVDTDRYSPSSQRMNPDAIARMDQLVELCEYLGLYMMLALDHAGCYIGGQWELNSYNRKNGGPAADAGEFFASPEARHRYQDRLRFLVARWGYSPAIAAWEFFNEVDNVSYAFEPRISDELVTDWHAAMSAYLSDIDPYQHLRTTSVSHRDIAGLNAIPTLDIDQRHIYGDSAWIADTLRQKTAETGRPYVVGEFAYEWDWSKDFNTIGAEMDSVFRLGMWRGLFSPTPILPMSWWWEFFDERDVVESLRPVTAVNAEMLAAGPLSAETAEWSGSIATAQAVRAGDSVYLLLVNGSDKVDSGAVQVATAVIDRVDEYDLGKGNWMPFTGSLNRLQVSARAARVFAIRSPASAQPQQ